MHQGFPRRITSILDRTRSYSSEETQQSSIDGAIIDFYGEFLTRGKLLRCKITDVLTIPSNTGEPSYALYEIEVLCQDLLYSIGKRYSQFARFHQRVIAKFILNFQFPRKHYLQASYSELITSERMARLNEFIDYILLQDLPELKYMLFQFLQIWDNYRKQGLSIMLNYEIGGGEEDEAILLEVDRMNQNPKNILNLIWKLRRMILSKKKKIKNQVIKRLICGYKDRKGIVEIDKKGIVEISLGLVYEFIAIEALAIVLELINSEKNKDSDSFLRYFQSIPISKLIAGNSHDEPTRSSLFENSQYKLLYFQLLRSFTKNKIDPLLSQYFIFLPNMEQDYLKWLAACEREQKQLAQTNQKPKLQSNYENNRTQFQEVLQAYTQISSNLFVQKLNQGEDILEVAHNQELVTIRMQCKKEFHKIRKMLLQMNWNNIFSMFNRQNYSDVVKRTLSYKNKKFRGKYMPQLISNQKCKFILKIEPVRGCVLSWSLTENYYLYDRGQLRELFILVRVKYVGKDLKEFMDFLAKEFKKAASVFFFLRND